ncbi:MAG: hypothetical protein Hals2KO_33130 [Halioglobus sp.]
MDELRLGFTPAGRGSIDTGAWLRNWQLGQVLRAQVVDTSQAGTVLLRIANHQVSASTNIFLQRGAWLNLQVTGLAPEPTVRVLDTPPRSAELTGPLERQTQMLLPRQGPVLGPLLTLLNPAQRVNLLSLLGASGGDLDPALNTLLWQGPPRTPEALQKALLQSGLFFESDLFRLGAQGAVATDLKALLFRLQARIAAARGDTSALAQVPAAASQLASLQGEVEGALAALSLNQLAASQQQQQDAWIWVFHVPFTLRDEMHRLSITLRREAADAGEEVPEREWKALLQLDLPRLGALEVEVFLRGVRVSAVFYSGRRSSVLSLQRALGKLEAVLRQHHFEVGVLRAHHGERKQGPQGEPAGTGFRHSV